MYCSQCGKQINNADKFCPHCGAAQNQNNISNAPSSENATKNEVVQLVGRAMQGDDSVWGEIYEKTHRYVYFMALKFLRSDQDAQDITQEVYIQAIRSIGQLYSADSFFGWLRSIVYSKCKDFVKKKKPTLLEDEAQGWLENIPEIDDKFLPDMTLDSAESRRMILELIDALPYLQRQAVMFYYYDEMTIDQIAALMECPAGTVKSRLNYARQQIKNGVKEHERKGIKLYGVATLPIIVMLLREQASTLPIPPSLGSNLAPIIPNTSPTSPTTTSTANVQPSYQSNNPPPTSPLSVNEGNIVGNAASTVATSSVALSTKIIGCVLAAALVIGCGLFIWLSSGNDNNVNPVVDSNIRYDISSSEVATESPEPNSVQELDYMLLYAPVLAEYREFISNGVIENGNPDWQHLWDEILPDWPPWIPSDFGFALHDLNGNGIKDLILLTRNYTVHAIFSIADRTPNLLHMHNHWLRGATEIGMDGTVFFYFSNVPEEGFFRNFTISYDGRDILTIEAAEMEAVINPETFDIEHFNYVRITPQGERIEITEEEWQVIRHNHWSIRTKDAGLTFIPLFDEESGAESYAAEEPTISEEQPTTSQNWQELYFETIQAAIDYSLQADWANHDFFESEFPLNLIGFMLADLNFDGIPELLIIGDSVSAGDMVRIFTINQGEVELIFIGESSDIVYPQPHSAIQLYRRSSDGSLAYVLHGGNSGFDSGWGSFFLTNAATPMDNSFATQARIADYTWESEFAYDWTQVTATYAFNGREVDSYELNELFIEMLSGYEVVSYDIVSLGFWHLVSVFGWQGVSDNNIREFLALYVPER